MIEFFCENTAAEYACDKIWKGRIGRFLRRGDTIEMEVSGKGSTMYVIIGSYEYGRYLCIPDWGVGSPLAELRDSFWNREQLERQVSRADAITLSEALKAVANNMEDVG